MLIGVSYSGFGVATLATHHPELRPDRLIVIDSYFDLAARRRLLPDGHETAGEIDAEAGTTPAGLRRRSATRSRARAHRADGNDADGRSGASPRRSGGDSTGRRAAVTPARRRSPSSHTAWAGRSSAGSRGAVTDAIFWRHGAPIVRGSVREGGSRFRPAARSPPARTAAPNGSITCRVYDSGPMRRLGLLVLALASPPPPPRRPDSRSARLLARREAAERARRVPKAERVGVQLATAGGRVDRLDRRAAAAPLPDVALERPARRPQGAGRPVQGPARRGLARPGRDAPRSTDRAPGDEHHRPQPSLQPFQGDNRRVTTISPNGDTCASPPRSASRSPSARRFTSGHATISPEDDLRALGQPGPAATHSRGSRLDDRRPHLLMRIRSRTRPATGARYGDENAQTGRNSSSAVIRVLGVDAGFTARATSRRARPAWRSRRTSRRSRCRPFAPGRRRRRPQRHAHERRAGDDQPGGVVEASSRRRRLDPGRGVADRRVLRRS